jgi:hypothetical protein
MAPVVATAAPAASTPAAAASTAAGCCDALSLEQLDAFAAAELANTPHLRPRPPNTAEPLALSRSLVRCPQIPLLTRESFLPYFLHFI